MFGWAYFFPESILWLLTKLLPKIDSGFRINCRTISKQAWLSHEIPNTIQFTDQKDWLFFHLNMYLNCSVFLVGSQTSRAKSPIHTIQTKHVAFTLVGIWMDFALNKEVSLQKRFQPWWPLVLLLPFSHSNNTSSFLIDSTSSTSLIQHPQKQKQTKNN